MDEKEITKIESARNCRLKLLENITTILRNSLTTQGITNVILVCQEKEFPAHKHVLESSSTYFAEMFKSSFKETQSNRVELPAIHPDTMDFILRLLYLNPSADLAGLSFENYVKLFKSSHYLGIDPLTKFCSRQIELALDFPTFFEIWQLVSLYENCFKVDIIKKFLLSNRQIIVTDKRFLEVNDVQVKMLMDTILDIPIDDAFLQALLQWSKQNTLKSKQMLCECLQRLKCHNLTEAYIKSVICELTVSNNIDILCAVIQLHSKTVMIPTKKEQKKTDDLDNINASHSLKDVVNIAEPNVQLMDVPVEDECVTYGELSKELSDALFNSFSSSDVFCYYFGFKSKANEGKVFTNRKTYLEKLNFTKSRREILLELPFQLKNVFTCERKKDMYVLIQEKDYETFELICIKPHGFNRYDFPFVFTNDYVIADDGSVGWFDKKCIYHYSPQSKLCRMARLPLCQKNTCLDIVTLNNELFIVMYYFMLEKKGFSTIYKFEENGLYETGKTPFEDSIHVVKVLQNKIFFFPFGFNSVFYACQPLKYSRCKFYQYSMKPWPATLYNSYFEMYERQEDFIFHLKNNVYLFNPLIGKPTLITDKNPFHSLKDSVFCY